MQFPHESAARLTCIHVPAQRQVPSLADDVRAGLLTPPRKLPPKYFYDDIGSRIFEEICKTEEYYPSRTEEALLRSEARAIMRAARANHVVELGSGSSRKTTHLFDACESLGQFCSYWPFDVADTMLMQAGKTLTQRYEWLSVNAMVGDYTGGIADLPLPEEGRRLIVFLGGTIGNFAPDEARRILGEIRGLLRADDLLLLGADRVKNPAVLQAAYDDQAGVTARFNLNLLNVLNRELDADFDPEAFEHVALYDGDAEQVEMRLRSRRDQRIRLAAVDATMDLQAGEDIRTEISRKFTQASLSRLLGDAGMVIREHFCAPDDAYSLVLAGV